MRLRLRRWHVVRRWLLLAGAICSEVTGSLCMQGALDRPVLYVPVAAGFLTSFVLLTAALRMGLAIGVAYGIWAACGVALTGLLSSLIFDQALTWLMGLGFLLVIVGVLLVEMGSAGVASDDAAGSAL